MKRTFEVEWPDDLGPLWLNKSNLLMCLTSFCRGTRFTVKDVTGDDQADPSPETAMQLNIAGWQHIHKGGPK